MNHYFSVYLPFILSINKEFKDIYTVFAGGDDLFLIGPWNKIIDFALFLNNSFEDYVCNNKKITLSAGISVNKPGEPIPAISERAEDALKKSKGNKRNSITIFEETVKWTEFEGLNDVKKTIELWMDKSFINNAMLSRLNTFSEMAKYTKELFKAGEVIEADDWEYLKWRALFKYTLVRNVGKHLKGAEKNEAIQEVGNAAVWLEQYAGAMKIPVWQIIYNQR